MTLEPNASLPEPTLQECADFEDRARKMLHRAWDNPKDLGEDSVICANATALLSELRQHCSPQDVGDKPNPARENFHVALKLAWLAVWRARDYTVQGMARRSKAAKWPNAFDVIDVSRGLYSFDGASWFPHHYPLWDRDGEPVDRSRVDFNKIFQFQKQNAYYEGVMVSSPEQVLNDHKLALQWAYVRSELPDREGGISLRSCLLEGKAKHLGCSNREIPQCSDVICLSDFEIAGFRSASSSSIRGSRFECGLTLQGDFQDEFIPSSLEFGPRLRLTAGSASAGADLSMVPGLRSITADSYSFGKVLKLGARRYEAITIKSGGIDEIDAKGTTVDTLALVELNVQGLANFKETTVAKSLVLSRVDFKKSTTFEGAKLATETADPRLRPRVQFFACEFRSGAVFDDFEAGPADFTHSTFHQRASFKSATFLGPANFSDVRFNGVLDFSPRVVQPTIFHGSADFSLNLPVDGSTSFKIVVFTGAVFLSSAKFRNRHFRDETWFDRATFAEAPQFHACELHSKTSFAGAKFQWSDRQTGSWFDHAIGSRLAYYLRGTLKPETTLQSARLLEIVNCFRVLTALAKEIDANDLAFIFHKEELRAKYRLPIGNGVGRPEAFIGRWYGLLSDYGDSFVRPILWLLASLCAFSIFYGSKVPDQLNRVEAAIGVSLGMQFRPFAALDPGFGRLGDAAATQACETELKGAGPLSTTCMYYHLATDHGAELKAASFSQTLLSVAFLFLIALGLRRKYQVN